MNLSQSLGFQPWLKAWVGDNQFASTFLLLLFGYEVRRGVYHVDTPAQGCLFLAGACMEKWTPQNAVSRMQAELDGVEAKVEVNWCCSHGKGCKKLDPSRTLFCYMLNAQSIKKQISNPVLIGPLKNSHACMLKQICWNNKKSNVC